MAQKAVKKIGQYRLYKVEGYGTKKTLSGLLAKSREAFNRLLEKATE